MLNSDFEMVLDVENILKIDVDFNSDEYQNELKNLEIDKIAQEYFESEVLSEETINKLKNDYEFKVNLLKNIQARMEDIFVNNSAALYKELVTVINLLSQGAKYNIFEKYNEYSIQEISKLFRAYESLLTHSHTNNKEDFELTFNYYMTLLGAFNELSIINLIDVKRKKSIQSIIELLSESINTIKFSGILDETKVALLNSFQGGIILRFSNVAYISIQNKTIDEVISEYAFIYNKQVDGYHLSSKSELSIHNHDDRSNYRDFLINSTELLLLMIMKLERYEDNSFTKLSEIIEVYDQENNLQNTPLRTIKEFKKSLFNNFVYICDHTINMDFYELPKHILDKNNLSITNMQIIHHIILFSNIISENNLIYILKHMIGVPKMGNDYHEFHKLNILDVIINKFIQRNGSQSFNKVIPSILDYMKTSNTATHMMSAFSKIRLSLSHYFSLLGKEYLEVSQQQYFMGEAICAHTLIKNEYRGIFENIMMNNAISYFDSLGIANKFNKKELTIIGNKMMNDFFEYKEIKIKYDVSSDIEKVSEQILKAVHCDFSDIERHISSIISHKLFFKLAQCKVIEPGEELIGFKEIGYEIKEQDLMNGYKILYKYSYAYKESFISIFEKNETYIKKNITNLLLSYLLKMNT